MSLGDLSFDETPPELGFERIGGGDGSLYLNLFLSGPFDRKGMSALIIGNG